MSLIELRDITKSFGGLRPFRLQALSVDAGEIVAIDGLDRPAASVLTDLITGTTLPDTGSVVIEGMPTSVLGSQDEWLAFLDRFGIVNDRVVLLDELTIAANLAVPLTLEFDPMSDGVRRTVEALAAEIGLAESALHQPLRNATPLSRHLVRLGRAVALGPAILLVEHPTADLAAKGEVHAWAVTLRRLAVRRSLTTILVTADPRLPRNTATRHLVWHGTTGELSEAPRGWRRWIS